MRQSFPRRLDALAEVFNFIDAFADAHRLEESVRYALRLAVEELFTNAVKYNSAGHGNPALDITLGGKSLRVEFVDPDAERFDPTEQPEPSLRAPLEGRQPGRLGIHLIKRYFDRVDYDYQGRISTITLTKHLRPPHV